MDGESKSECSGSLPGKRHRVCRHACNVASGATNSGGEDRDPVVIDLERQLGEQLGTRVRLRTNRGHTKGKIVIDFFSHDHFEGLVRTLGVSLER